MTIFLASGKWSGRKEIGVISPILQVVVQDDFSIFQNGNSHKAAPRPSIGAVLLLVLNFLFNQSSPPGGAGDF